MWPSVTFMALEKHGDWGLHAMLVPVRLQLVPVRPDTAWLMAAVVELTRQYNAATLLPAYAGKRRPSKELPIPDPYRPVDA